MDPDGVCPWEFGTSSYNCPSCNVEPPNVLMMVASHPEYIYIDMYIYT